MITAEPKKTVADCELGSWVTLKGAWGPLVLVKKDNEYAYLYRKLNDEKWCVAAALTHEVE